MSRNEIDREYYRRREAESLRMAGSTDEKWVAVIHQRMARLYSERAAIAESQGLQQA